MKKFSCCLLVLVMVMFFITPSLAAVQDTNLDYTVEIIVENEEGGTVLGAGIYPAGKNAVLQATAADGYVFVGWYHDNTLISDSLTYEYDAELSTVFTAKFDKILTLSIIIDPQNCGSVSQSGSGSYHTGQTVTLHAAPSPNNLLIGWFGTSDELLSADATYSFSITQNTTITAKFATQYTLGIQIYPQGSGTATGTGSYTAGSVVDVEAQASDGFRFVGWVSSNDTKKIVSSDTIYSFNIDEPTSLIAKFDTAYSTIVLRIIIISGVAIGIIILLVVLIKRFRIIKRKRKR
ncbi:MAG: InlB B-repeat-containing protein [Christensenellaceae bacterium]